jgi:cell division protein FtsB
MTERRGAGPGGRGDRRSSRSARSRSERTAAPAAGKRAVPRRSTSTRSESGVAATKSPSARAAQTPRAGKTRREHKFLGLSTGRAVVLAAVLCALALTLAVPMRTYFSQRAEATQLAQQRRDLEADVARLRERRAQQQDPHHTETEARERLRLVMPGDTAYIVQVPGIEQPAVPTPAAAPRKPDPWYTRLWNSMNTPQPVHAAAPEPSPPPPAPE